MIELVENQDSTAFDTTLHDVVEAGIEIYKSELHVLVLVEKLIQTSCQIQLVNVNNVVKPLGAYQAHESGVVFLIRALNDVRLVLGSSGS